MNEPIGDTTETTKIALFKGRQIRKIFYQNEWWFSVVDVIEALTETERPRKYWSDLKKKLIAEGYSELSENIGQLKLPSADGKFYETDCANAESIFRLIQSIPSPKAEPFKRWLAKVGYERVQEIENPELAVKRTRTLYKLKRYGEDWIEKILLNYIYKKPASKKPVLILGLGRRTGVPIDLSLKIRYNGTTNLISLIFTNNICVDS
ncbi:MAG: hypothetical protein A3J93_03485 [Candidatus Magasanikbacteria bacterium RIFOXYC2_FULL_42_28]|uniref:Bro-N domain-containing protein n=1 Tax=Candidatus Magasanikbacteria bacterium RIFOXYC2_FULL_42_28 TaxID=1798704 RepID=A0A1F6NUR8_9BACT|nr:MAG: hypothetical protein A3J93_03485 [Candidatus Magasanikbacteria bacterium RIFOXYC2_FULL_42_28]